MPELSLSFFKRRESSPDLSGLFQLCRFVLSGIHSNYSGLQATTLALRGPGWLAPLLRGRRNDGLVIIFNRTEVEIVNDIILSHYHKRLLPCGSSVGDAVS